MASPQNDDGPGMFVDVAPLKGFCILAAIVVGGLAAAALVGGIGPQVFVTSVQYAYECPDQSHVWNSACMGSQMSINGSEFIAELENLTSMAQFWSLTMMLGNPGMQPQNLPQFGVAVNMSLNQAGSSVWNLADQDLKNVDITCQNGNEWCNPVVLIVEPYILANNYLINISFPDPQLIGFIGDVAFAFTFVDPAYTALALSIRIIFFVLSLIIAVLFVRRVGGLGREALNAMSYEQRWLIFLLGSILLYNNPLSPFDFAYHNWFMLTLSATLETLHSIGAELFLLCMFDRMRLAGQGIAIEPKRFYIPKLLYTGILGLVEIIIQVYFATTLQKNPVVGWSGSMAIGGVFIFIIIMHLLLILWIIALMVLAGLRTRTNAKLWIRYKFLTITTVFYLLFMIIAVSTGNIGSIGRSALAFVFFYTLRNAYVAIMVVGYWPMDDKGFQLFRTSRPAGWTPRESDSLMGSGDINSRYASAANPFK